MEEGNSSFNSKGCHLNNIFHHSDSIRKLWYERGQIERKELNREFKLIHPSIARQAMRNSKANVVLQSNHYAEKLESWDLFSALAQFL